MMMNKKTNLTKQDLKEILQSCMLNYEHYTTEQLIDLGLDKKNVLIGIKLLGYLEDNYR